MKINETGSEGIPSGGEIQKEERSPLARCRAEKKGRVKSVAALVKRRH